MELAEAINSMGGKAPTKAEVTYLFWMAAFVNRAARGYVKLRECGMVDASKLLVRPVLEAIFFATAVFVKPGFLYSKAFSEWREENKYSPKDAAGSQMSQDALDQIESFFEATQGYSPTFKKKVTVEDAAKAADLQSTYESTYRIYCQFTHGAMKAVTGELNEVTEQSDTRMVTLSVLKMLELLKTHTVASVPNFDSLHKRL